MESISFDCSECKHKLLAPTDKAGRRAKCTHCGSVVTIPASSRPETKKEPRTDLPPPEQGPTRAAKPRKRPPASQPTPPADEEPDEEPILAEEADEGSERRPVKKTKRRRRAQGDPDASSWRHVRRGLLLLLIEAGFAFLVALLGYIGGKILLNRLLEGNLGALLFPLRAQVVCSILQSSVLLVGFIHLAMVPVNYVGRGFTIATVAIVAFNTIAAIAASISVLQLLAALTGAVPDPNNRPDPEAVMEMMRQLQSLLGQFAQFSVWSSIWSAFIQVMSYAQLIAVPLYFRALAQSIQEEGIAENCLNLLKLNAASLGVGLVLQLVIRLQIPFVFRLLGMVGWVGFLLGLAQKIWYVGILLQLRTALAQKIH